MEGKGSATAKPVNAPAQESEEVRDGKRNIWIFTGYTISGFVLLTLMVYFISVFAAR